MIFKNVDQFDNECKGKLPKKKIERNGFYTVVEWGALNLL
jgi:hypothetical protein